MSRRRSKAKDQDVEEATGAAPSKRRGTRFVPMEDVPVPGLSPRAREVLAIALSGVLLSISLWAHPAKAGETPQRQALFGDLERDRH